MKLSIVIPTLGRKTLKRALDSIESQRAREDEVIVVGDGPQPEAANVMKTMGRGYRYLETVPTRRWGHAQRNLGMLEASGDYIGFMDDDDYYLPDAFSAMRKAAEQHPDIGLFLFRMKIGNITIWKDKGIRVGNVSTQMILLKRVFQYSDIWKPNPDTKDGGCGDFLFIENMSKHIGLDKVRFEEAFVAKLEKHSLGK